MVKVIIGKKGTGKTKQLIDRVNEAVRTDNGHIVFIDSGTRHMLDLDHNIRLVDTAEFEIDDFKVLYGLICGIISEDFDISNIFIDNLTKIIQIQNIEESKPFFKKLENLGKKYNITFTLIISMDMAEAPEYVKQYA